MHGVICDVCGAKKGPANRWWSFFEVESSKAALIGPLEDAPTLQQWIPKAARSNVCGEECLYRKLSRVLGPRVNGLVEGRQLDQTASQRYARDEPSVNAKPIRYKGEKGNEDSSFLQPKQRASLWRRAVVGKANEGTAHDPAPHSPNATTSINEKLPSANLRDADTLGDGLKITGEIASNEPLFVNGELVGILKLPNHRLTVGAKGKIRAAVSAKEVEIFGLLEGEVKANKVVIRKNGILLGNVRTLAFVIDPGGRFEGNSSMRLDDVDQQYKRNLGTAQAVHSRLDLEETCRRLRPTLNA